MLNLDDFKADLTEITNDLPITFQFNGTNHVGFAGLKVSRETLEPGGFLDDLDRNLNVALFKVTSSGSFVNTFPGATPTLGDKLVLASDGTYTVATIKKAQDNLLLSFGLMTVNR